MDDSLNFTGLCTLTEQLSRYNYNVNIETFCLRMMYSQRHKHAVNVVSEFVADYLQSATQHHNVTIADFTRGVVNTGTATLKDSRS